MLGGLATNGAGYGRLDPGWPRGMKPWERDERLSKKGGDSASADAWNRVAKAIALIELESIRLMLDRGPGRS